MSEPPIAAVVLAAGGSTRLGRPKQLVRIDGQPLVRRAARAALEAGCAPVLVVVGAAADAVSAAVADLPVRCVTNRSWTDGVATSIACGVRSIAADRSAGCLVFPCDQPRLTSGILVTLIERFRRGGAAAVGCAYSETVGPPALFSPELFDRLSALTGDNGAKQVLRGCPTLAVVDFADGALDIDSEADLRALSFLQPSLHRVRKPGSLPEQTGGCAGAG